MKHYQYGMEPNVEMRVQKIGICKGSTLSINGVEAGKLEAQEIVSYYGWQWAIVHGSRLTASGSGGTEAEAYKETIDAFNLGLKMIARSN